MASLDDLLAAKRNATAKLEKTQRGCQLTLGELDEARRAVETAWSAAAGGVVLRHADEDSDFRTTLTDILYQKIGKKRDRTLLDEWKVGTPSAPDQKPDAPDATDTKSRKARRRHLDSDFDLETLSGTELLQNVKQLEQDVQLQQKEVADARREADLAGKALRRRDNRWRIKVGETILEYAGTNGEFRQSLDRIFDQRIKEQHRALLDLWRNRTAAAVATPPPTPADHRGWRPKKLPDGAWGAAFSDPAGKTLPDPLLGASIVVTTRKGDEWSTKITEVVGKNDAEILVRTEERQDTGQSRSTPPAAKNRSAKTTKKTSDAAVEEPAG